MTPPRPDVAAPPWTPEDERRLNGIENEAKRYRFGGDTLWLVTKHTLRESRRRSERVTDATRARQITALVDRLAARHDFDLLGRVTRVLEHNPVRDVRPSRENPARETIYAPEEVRALVEAMEPPYRAMAALMGGTGMEYQAVARLRRRDVDLVNWRVHAQGSKTPWRNREVAVTEPWARRWIAEHVATVLPGAPLFDGVTHTALLHAHHAAVTALKLPPSKPHDHRHHYAVALRRRGVSDLVIARQLGHRDTTLVQKRYGRYLPTIAEVEEGAKPAKAGSSKRPRAGVVS